MNHQIKIIITLLSITLLSITLSACLPTAEDPKTVADQYWQHLQNGNTEAAKKLATHANQQQLQLHSNHIISGSNVQNGSTKAIVSTTITTINPTTHQIHKQSFDTVLVLQNGHWKVDLGQTDIPPPPSAREEEIQQLAEDLNESMQENMESLDEAMDQGMQYLNEAMRDGSKEMGDSLLYMMNELNQSMKESVDKLKQRREQQLQEQQQQEQLQQSQPDPSKGEGRI